MAKITIEIPEEKILEYIGMEKAVHPWMDDKLIRRMVMDELQADPEHYECEEEEKEESTETEEE